MAKYRKNPFASMVFLPGIGRLEEGRILTGDYQKYVPQFLWEIPEDGSGVPLENTETERGPALLTEPSPFSEGSLDENGEPVPVKRGRGRPRKNPVITE